MPAELEMQVGTGTLAFTAAGSNLLSASDDIAHLNQELTIVKVLSVIVTSLGSAAMADNDAVGSAAFSRTRINHYPISKGIDWLSYPARQIHAPGAGVVTPMHNVDDGIDGIVDIGQSRCSSSRCCCAGYSCSSRPTSRLLSGELLITSRSQINTKGLDNADLALPDEADSILALFPD